MFRLESSYSSVVETTHIISAKTLSPYHDFSMPAWNRCLTSDGRSHSAALGRQGDVVGHRTQWMPRVLRSKVDQFLLRLLEGANRDYARPAPEHAFGARRPTVNSALFCALRHGHNTPRFNIARFDGHTVH